MKSRKVPSLSQEYGKTDGGIVSYIRHSLSLMTCGRYVDDASGRIAGLSHSRDSCKDERFFMHVLIHHGAVAATLHVNV